MEHTWNHSSQIRNPMIYSRSLLEQILDNYSLLITVLIKSRNRRTQKISFHSNLRTVKNCQITWTTQFNPFKTIKRGHAESESLNGLKITLSTYSMRILFKCHGKMFLRISLIWPFVTSMKRPNKPKKAPWLLFNRKNNKKVMSLTTRSRKNLLWLKMISYKLR